MSKLTEKVGQVISFPWRKYYGYKGSKADIERKIILEARNSEGAPQFDMQGKPTEAFKVQTMANWIKEKYKK